MKKLLSIRSNLRNLVKNFRLKQRYSSIAKRTTTIINKHPIISFLVILGVLLLVIVAGNFVRRPPKEDTTPKTEVKSVQMYSIGKTPITKYQAKIEKTGIIEIKALMGGVVQNVNVKVGQEVKKGANLVSISSNYQGGNAASIQRQLAGAQYNNITSTFDTQKDLIKKQREVADKTSENTEELRKISEQSVSGTETAINLNNSIISSLNTTLQQLESTNTNGSNDAQILQTRQALSQYHSGNTQLQTQLNQTKYQTNKDNAPTELSNLQKEITLKQLEIQEKALELSRETSRLQLQLAQVQEAAMYPAAPFSGVIERVHVNPGQAVNPGQTLVTLHGAQTMTAVVTVPAQIAQNVSRIEPSTITINSKTIQSVPLFVSTEATYGQLYSIIYEIPEEYQDVVTNNSFITVEVPLGVQSTNAITPFVPLDAIYQTQDSAYVFIDNKGKAESRKVTLGNIQGEYVEVTQGVNKGDDIILSRTVINGDKVKRIN